MLENSPVKLIPKINKNKLKYNKRPQYTGQTDTNKFYKQKFLNDSFHNENEKNYDYIRNSYNNFSFNTNYEINRNREYAEISIKNKNYQFIINNNNNNKKNNIKRNKNYDFSFTKEYSNTGKVNTNHNTIVDEEKSTISLNHNLYKNNNYSYRLNDIQGYHKNNYSINHKYDSKYGNYDSFYGIKNNSLQIKSYILNKSKNESSIKRGKITNTKKK